MTELPTGERESQRLEFKDARALNDSATIPGEVVAMLNSKGGIIWIGVPEEDGIALEPKAIPNAERKRVDLLNRLISCIEPRFSTSEVEVETVPIGSGNEILRVAVHPPTNGPRIFASLRKGMRGFFERVDHRLVMIERPELEKRLSDASAVVKDDGFQQATNWLRMVRERVESDYPDCSYMAAVPESATTTDHPRPPTKDQTAWWDEALKLEHSSWNRGGSRSLLSARFKRSFSNDRLIAEPEDEEMRDRWRLEADRHGRLLAVFPTESLLWRDPEEDESESQRQLHPYQLIGATVSFLELLSGWTGQLMPSDERSRAMAASRTIWLQTRLQDRSRPPLRRGSPQSPEFMYWKKPSDLSRSSVIWDEGVRVKLDQERLWSSPQAIARLVLEHVYESFGFSPNDVPFEVTGNAGDIELP